MVTMALSSHMVKQAQVKPIPLLEELRDIMTEVLSQEQFHISSMKFPKETHLPTK